MVKYEKGFKNDKLGLELDIYYVDGVNEWFLAKDVSDFLGYSKAGDMTRLISFEENLASHNMRIGNTNTNVTMINEFGLNEILCKITKSDIKRWNKARVFQRWVFGEVLPLIRKNGAYVNVTKDDTPETIDAKIEAGAEEARRRYEQYQDEELASASSEIENLTARNDYLEDENDKLSINVSRLKKIVKYFLDRDKRDFIERNDIKSIPTDSVKYNKFLQDLSSRLVRRDPIYKDIRIPDYYEREEEFYV